MKIQMSFLICLWHLIDLSHVHLLEYLLQHFLNLNKFLVHLLLLVWYLLYLPIHGKRGDDYVLVAFVMNPPIQY